MEKPRSDAKLLNLLPHQHDQIVVWMTEGVGDKGDTSYKAVREQIWQEWGIRTSNAALTHYWRRVVSPRLLRQSAQAAGALVDAAEGTGAIFEGGAKEMLRQKTFELLADPGTDAKELGVFFGLIQNGQKLQLKKEELALQRDRFKAAVAKKIDLGLQEFYEEIKASPDALALYERLRDVVQQGVAAS